MDQNSVQLKLETVLAFCAVLTHYCKLGSLKLHSFIISWFPYVRNQATTYLGSQLQDHKSLKPRCLQGCGLIRDLNEERPVSKHSQDVDIIHLLVAVGLRVLFSFCEPRVIPSF